MKDIITDTIGCDLGDKYNAICILKPDGSLERHRVRATPTAMRMFFARPACHVVIEVGTHSRWVAVLLGHG